MWRIAPHQMAAKAAKITIRPIGSNQPPYTIQIVGGADGNEVLSTVTGNQTQTLTYDPSSQNVRFPTLKGHYELANTYTVTMEGGDGGHATQMADKPRYTSSLAIVPTPGAHQPHNPHYSMSWIGTDGLTRSASGFAPNEVALYDPNSFAFHGSTGTYDVTIKTVGEWSDEVVPPVFSPSSNLLGLGGTTPNPGTSPVTASHSWLPWLLLILAIVIIAYLVYSNQNWVSTVLSQSYPTATLLR